MNQIVILNPGGFYRNEESQQEPLSARATVKRRSSSSPPSRKGPRSAYTVALPAELSLSRRWVAAKSQCEVAA